MKKTLLMLLSLIIVTVLLADHLTPVELGNGGVLTYGGEFRTRAIYRMLKDGDDSHDGGWFDSRLRFDLGVKLADKLGIMWTTEVGDLEWGTDAAFSNTNVDFETRELYLDYQMNWMDMKIRLGQQYWYDHRSIVLDDYFPGITADMTVSDIPMEFGFIKWHEGDPMKLDDAHVAFAAAKFKMPVDWGLAFMFGQKHEDKMADFWIIPNFLFKFAPVELDLTAVLNHQMFKDLQGDDDSQMGIAVAAKAEADVGVKLGLDVLYVTKEGICGLSPWYENGLYIFGNKLAYDGIQYDDDVYMPYGEGEDPYMSMVVSAKHTLCEKKEVFVAGGMVQRKEVIGTEFNVGLNVKILDNLTFNPVLAAAIPGEEVYGKEKMVLMLGGLLKAEF